jgi:hypothetical protein
LEPTLPGMDAAVYWTEIEVLARESENHPGARRDLIEIDPGQLSMCDRAAVEVCVEVSFLGQVRYKATLPGDQAVILATTAALRLW